jgi:cysteine-rich repeat protein
MGNALYTSMWVIVIAIAGCLQSAPAAPARCDTGGVCPPGLRCGMIGDNQICVAPTCGNGRPDPGEACDDSNNISSDGCPADCAAPCSDGTIDPGEACDDTNLLDGDGCDHNCTATGCGNGVVTSGEACDDGNASDGDGCDLNCTATACGNGVVTSGEACDDGNASEGDGCQPDCTITCVRQRSSLVISPDVPPLIPGPGVPVSIDFALTNHNSGTCPPIFVELSTLFAAGTRLGALALAPSPFDPASSGPVPSGTTTHLTLSVTAADWVEPGSSFGVVVTIGDSSLFTDSRTLTFTVGEPLGCHVSTQRELMIRNLSIVRDPVRSRFDPASSDPRNGVWTFKHLVENLAPTPADARAMVEAMLQSFATTQTINGFSVAARPRLRTMILDRWPRAPGGELDLGRAPLRLLAIVNRFDLRNLQNGDAGEARFVFGFREVDRVLQATIMLNYKLPAATDDEVLDWAQAFHGLGAFEFGESYNAALQLITERIVGRGARPGHINGSALDVVQTNEHDFGNNNTWEMRELRLSSSSDRLEPSPLALTPDRTFQQSSALVAYLQANQVAILAGTHVVPPMFDGALFQAGSIINNNTWLAPGVDGELRHQFARNTCNGCHAVEETRAAFMHIEPSIFGDEAELSPFLTGVAVVDPVSRQLRWFNELGRRNADLEAIVCSGAQAAAR